MTRRELVDATYDAAERLNELKVQHGRLSQRRGRRVARSIAQRAPCARGSTPEWRTAIWAPPPQR